MDFNFRANQIKHNVINGLPPLRRFVASCNALNMGLKLGLHFYAVLQLVVKKYNTGTRNIIKLNKPCCKNREKNTVLLHCLFKNIARIIIALQK